ncbi:hypothetical protein TVAG_141980 [Trichomonas vaginalis G3]|uniref:Uncharacterized protein n=1 Tax=Trichomonas vaginalis (strain ATCC PRA-98 / G3) TaxID=412133 RepID=A2FWR1_TRIV3|nr:hypothetical protein TVAGG3_0248780 [Trichomonas vaginalis G3]EAX90654.1 hypothetical protein TVAG_141980 [Trichomonas vaginalis G3]KAI5553842.1 hypothetical protein TVAGG3_0248780 [Trichomonas vaginalis G3]|eukprot:XP_001303584.1 hypothetical protein [Trichomonas vaginalis G3]
MAASDEKMPVLIANVFTKENGTDVDEVQYLPENEIWSRIIHQEKFNNLDEKKKSSIYRRFLTALHSNRTSLAFFESKYDPETKQNLYRLRSSSYDIAAMSQSYNEPKYSPNERNTKRIEELQREIRKLRSEIAQLEMDNMQWQNTIDQRRQSVPPEVLQNFSTYEKYAKIIDERGAKFVEVEKEILKIGSTVLKK